MEDLFNLERKDKPSSWLRALNMRPYALTWVLTSMPGMRVWTVTTFSSFVKEALNLAGSYWSVIVLFARLTDSTMQPTGWPITSCSTSPPFSSTSSAPSSSGQERREYKILLQSRHWHQQCNHCTFFILQGGLCQEAGELRGTERNNVAMILHTLNATIKRLLW